MGKDHVVFDFLRFSVVEKIGFGGTIITNLTGSTVFTDPDVPLATLSLQKNTLQTCYEASLKGGREETKLMHQAEDEWDDGMRKTALYVDRIADGNGALILNAGFNLVKQRSPVQRAELTVTQGELPGTVDVRRIAVDGAIAYIWQYCKDPLTGDNSGWITADTTAQASATLTGLMPLTRYWFRVAPVTRSGTGAYGTPVMLAVV